MSAPRDVARWLDARTPTPPRALAARLRQVMADDGARPAREAASFTLERGAVLLEALLRDGCRHRASALDLLAADALITYAYEAAADDPATLDRYAREGMARIASVARGLGEGG